MTLLTQRAVQRAVAGALKAGMDVGRVEVDPRTGRIVLLSEAEAAARGDDLDQELKAWEATHGEGRS